jgi:hypothetical protein
MTPEMLEVLAQMAHERRMSIEQFMRVLMYEHKCTGAQMHCCGMLRCESCHAEHMKTCHSYRERDKWSNLAQSSTLCQPELKDEFSRSAERDRVTKLIVKEKRERKAVPKREAKHDKVKELLESLSMEELLQFAARMKEHKE